MGVAVRVLSAGAQTQVHVPTHPGCSHLPGGAVRDPKQGTRVCSLRSASPQYTLSQHRCS